MIRYIENVPSAKEFNYLTDSVGWGTRKNNIIDEALRNTLYSLCVYDDDKLIGFGFLSRPNGDLGSGMILY